MVVVVIVSVIHAREVYTPRGYLACKVSAPAGRFVMPPYGLARISYGMSTHALSTTDASIGLRIMRNLDVAVLALALPVFIAAELPLLGWAAATVAWLASRAVQAFAERRALESGDRRVAMGARAATLMGRLYLVGLTVLAAGIVEREAGLAGGILSVLVFTVYFTTLLIVKPLEEARR